MCIRDSLSEVLLKYRQHVESIGYKQRSSQINSTINAVAAACQRRGSKFDINKLNVRTSQASMFDIHLKWAWWAYKSNQNRTGKKHALRALRAKPWNIEALKVLYLLSTSN